MMMKKMTVVLQRCDPALLDECDDPDQLDCVEAARMDLYLTESRRVQKVVWRQLFVLDSMVALLEGQESAQQLMTLPCPPPPDGSARARWKALKAESRAGVEETEGLFKSLERIEQIHERRQTLTQLVQRLHNKKQQTKQLVEALKKAKNALQSCEHQLIQLMAEAEAGLGRLIDWQQLRDELQAYMSAVQDVMQINLLSFNQSELCVELRPRPTSRMSSNELEPLRLSITWSHDDRFRLQVNEGTAGLEEDSIVGRRSELSAALLEVMQCYEGQFELLSEIQGLRSSFAIDWRPTQRLLIYLKSALLVCHLEVEEGYPSSGRARLLSVRRDGQPVDTSELKPYKSDLSLTDWLVFLCSSPLI